MKNDAYPAPKLRGRRCKIEPDVYPTSFYIEKILREKISNRRYYLLAIGDNRRRVLPHELSAQKISQKNF